MFKAVKYMLGAFLALLLACFLVLSYSSGKSFAQSPPKEFRLLLNVMGLIRTQYVEEVTPAKLIEGAMNGMLRSLDPYSQYLNKEAFEDLKADTEGKFGGIGVEIGIKNGHLNVIAPLDGSPAELAGIKSGDAIMKIDDSATHDMMISDATKKLRGAPGSTVKLTILRHNELKDISITRDWVKVKSIKEAKLLSGNIGYVKLTAFQEKSAEDFESALSNLETQGMAGLILDLRNNSGGLLVSGVEVAEKFIPKGKLIVTTKGRRDKNKVEYISRNLKPHVIKPLVVLVNKGSASSSEIVAGALQDYGIGTLVGTQTYGKGSIQSLIPITRFTSIRLTTSRYYTPSGRLIHEVGIKPDVLAEDAPPAKDGAEAAADAQLAKAVEVIKEQSAKK